MFSRWIFLDLAYFVLVASASVPHPTPTPSPTRPVLTLPFASPLTSAFPKLDLFRRDNCPLLYAQCDNVGASQACCYQTATCTTDGNHNVACCNFGAYCTGTLGGGSVTGTGGFGGFGSATATSFTGPTVSGVAYPWVIIPTSFPNQGVCSSYYTSCSTEYGKCTAALGGGAVNGVTVNAGNGAGITVQGATATAAAASVCSGIQAAACHGLPLSYCSQLPTGGTNMADNKRAGIGGVFAGAVVGVLGGLL